MACCRPKKGPKHRYVADIAELYDVQNIIGESGYATVRVGIDKEDASKWALNVIAIEVYEAKKAKINDETKLVSTLAHPGVAKIKESVVTDNSFVIVMELLSGGEIVDAIAHWEKYTEKDAKKLIKSMLEGVAYLHSKKCIHRDLKAESVIFTDESYADAKITDFGNAISFKSRGAGEPGVGSPEYVSPEAIKGVYTEKGDVWSVGVISYVLLCGFQPFDADDDELNDKIAQADFSFPENVPDGAKAFLKSLMHPDSNARSSAVDALNDQWLNSAEDKVLESTLQVLKTYNATRKLRKTVLVVVASVRMMNAVPSLGSLSEDAEDEEDEGEVQELTPAQKKQYRAVFDMFDKDGGGSIDAQELQKVLNITGSAAGTGRRNNKLDAGSANAKRLLQRWDENGDGEIDFDEFCKIMSLRQQTWDKSLEIAFKFLDKDGDGMTSKTEIKALLEELGQAITAEELDLIMAEVDKDGNGDVDIDEFRQMMSLNPASRTSSAK